jgi:hypothetical protein
VVGDSFDDVMEIDLWVEAAKLGRAEQLTASGNIHHLNLRFSRKLNEGADDEEEPVFGRA